MKAMKKTLLPAMLAAALAGCQPAPQPSTGEVAAGAGKATALASADATPADAYQRAMDALADERMLSPAGDNAVEHYLAARAQASADGRAQAALVELQPYLLIAVEQALARGDATEADRLLSLVARVDADAPAVPRLRAALDALHASQASTAARAVAASAATPAPQSIAPGPAPAAREPPAAAVAAAPSPAPNAPMPVANDAPSVSAAPSAAEAPLRASPSPAVRTPRLLADAAPRYPLPALRARVEGQAEVAFTIQPDGSVRDVRVLSSTPQGMFDASAAAVAQRWRFEATGEAHATRRTVRFRLPAEGAGGQ